MSLTESPKKMTVAQSQAWIGDNLAALLDMEPEAYIMALKAAIPKKPRSSGPASNSAEGGAARAVLDYDDTRCNAAVYVGPRVGGFRAQCSCKKPSSSELCKRHTAEADDHSGQVKNGFFNEERPSHHYGDETDKLIPWHDVTLEKTLKAKATKSSGVRCCSNCGAPGHNKTKCPEQGVSDITEDALSSMATSKLKRHARSLGVTLAKLDLADDADDVKAFVIDLIQAASAKKAAKAEQEKQEKQETEETEEKEETEETEPSHEEEDEEDLIITDDEGEVDDSCASMVNALDELEEDHSDGAGTGLETDLVFEGVSYTRDGDEVLNDDLDTIGSWDGEKIEFNSNKNKRIHTLMAKLEKSKADEEEESE